MERTEARIGRVLVERACKEGREESELIEDALRLYLREADESRLSMSESLDSGRYRCEREGIPNSPKKRPVKIAVEGPYAYRGGE